MSKVGNSVINKLSGSTEVEVIKVSYTWTINNFSFLSRHLDKKIKSPIFTMGPNNEYKWRLRMYPNGCDTSDTHLSLFLQLLSHTQSEILVKFDFSIIKADECFHVLAGHKIRTYTQWKSLGYHELIDRNKLMDESNGFLKDDTLSILCEVSVGTGNISTQQTRYVPEKVKPEINLMRDLGSLMDTETFSDLTLIAEGERFQVHKAILSARSPVFQAMFQHDMIERSQTEIEIKDTEKEVLKELIRFIYSGKVARLHTIAVELLEAADKYAVEDLKLMCEREISKNLTVDNAVDALMVADRHNSVTLKKQALMFIRDNAIRLVDNFMTLVLNDERGPERIPNN